MPRSRFAVIGGGARGIASRRQTRWLRSADETSFTSVAAGGVDFQSSLTTEEKALRPFTVVRVRGWLFCQNDQSAATERSWGAVGMAVVSDQAVAAGVASLPSPISDEASDLWFAYQYMYADFHLSAVGSSALGGAFTFESKAMRKVEDGQDVVVMMENGDATFGINYLVKFRMLVKLH